LQIYTTKRANLGRSLSSAFSNFRFLSAGKPETHLLSTETGSMKQHSMTAPPETALAVPAIATPWPLRDKAAVVFDNVNRMKGYGTGGRYLAGARWIVVDLDER
jgi:hypothetical protein